MKKQVFVVSCSPRSGSSMLQRLLMSHPDMFMWGEARWVIRHVAELCKSYNARKSSTIRGSWNNLKKDGPIVGWYATLMPMVNMEQLAARWLNDMLKHPKKPGGSWGCKFVLLRPEHVEFLHEIFPDAGFIFLERRWEQVEPSIKLRHSWWPSMTMADQRKHWETLTKFFKTTKIPGLHIHYDKITNGDDSVVGKLERYLGMNPGSLNRKVLRNKIASKKPAENTYSE